MLGLQLTLQSVFLKLFKVFGDLSNDILVDDIGNYGVSKTEGCDCSGSRCLWDALLATCVSYVCYYSQAPHIVLGGQGEAEKLIFAYFFLTGVVLFVVAAEFHNNVMKCKTHFNLNSENEDDFVYLGEILVLGSHKYNATATLWTGRPRWQKPI